MKKYRHVCRQCDYYIGNTKSLCSNSVCEECSVYTEPPNGTSKACGCLLIAKGQECPNYKPTRYPVTNEEQED